MALNLPPIPNGPISETPIWRSWFTRLQASLTTTTGGSVPIDHNALSSIQGGDVDKYHLTAAEVSKLAGIEAGAEVNNISDVNATDLTDGGVTTLHKHNLSALNDVNLTSVSDGQALLYNTATSKWINGTVSGGGGSPNLDGGIASSTYGAISPMDGGGA